MKELDAKLRMFQEEELKRVQGFVGRREATAGYVYITLFAWIQPSDRRAENLSFAFRNFLEGFFFSQIFLICVGLNPRIRGSKIWRAKSQYEPNDIDFPSPIRQYLHPALPASSLSALFFKRYIAPAYKKIKIANVWSSFLYWLFWLK